MYVPKWIDQDITMQDVAAIQQGGCDSGAFMPAVTYYQALETMNECGDEIIGYLEDMYDEVPAPDEVRSWSSLAVFYVSCAVEAWAESIEDPDWDDERPVREINDA